MDRRCGDCTVCCTVTAVPELQKPCNQTCVFADKGCTIYPDRPQSCRTFECAWLQGDMPKWMRPDKVHMMLWKLPNDPVVMAYAEPGHERPWLASDVESALRQTYTQHGVPVVTNEGHCLLPTGHHIDDVMKAVAAEKAISK